MGRDFKGFRDSKFCKSKVRDMETRNFVERGMFSSRVVGYNRNVFDFMIRRICSFGE